MQSGNLDSVKQLLAAGADVNERDSLGSTPLHDAAWNGSAEIAVWLLDHGANPNTRAAVDSDGFGNHTALFHAVVGLGSRDDQFARLLLSRGAGPTLRATLRKQLRDMGDPEKERLHEFHQVTPTEYARQYQEPRWVNEPALAALAEYERRAS